MRYTDRFNHVLKGVGRPRYVLELGKPVLWRQEVIKFAVEAEPRAHTRHGSYCRAWAQATGRVKRDKVLFTKPLCDY